MFLARTKLSKLVLSQPLLCRYFSSLSDRAASNLTQFYESLPQQKLNSLVEVKELLLTIKENIPENEAQCKNAAVPLNAFFEDNYRVLNPDRNIHTLREILEVGELCTQLYPSLGVGQAFRKEPWFWVWSGLEEELRPELGKLQVGELIRTYQIFFANQKGSQEFWANIQHKITTLNEEELNSEEAKEVFARQELYSNLYKN